MKIVKLLSSILLTILITILLFGCNNVEDIEKQNKINDYTKRLEEWNTYFIEVAELSMESDDTNRNIIENFEMAKNNDEEIPYAKILLLNYQKQYEEALDIRVPAYVKECHNHYLEYLTQNITAASSVINYDSSSYTEAAEKAFSEYTVFMSEVLRIWEDFDKEAVELGLEKPFSDIK